MGIKGLMKLINDYAPRAVKEQEIDNYFARKVAIDASMSLYQFLIQIRSGPEGEVLTNEQGEVTSHLQGMFYRTIRMLDNGLKPVFVFDGKPPELKKGELAKRTEKRDKAEEGKKEAEEAENQEDINKYKKQLVKVTKEHNEETRHLLRLMGVPIVEAPSEAEAQCAALVKAGVVYAVATEDMDVLTFGTPRMLRHLTSPAARKEPIQEIHLQTVLDEMKLTMEQFIEMCILCGCDYTINIKGVGPQTALKLIKDHGTIKSALAHMKKDGKLPESTENEFNYTGAAELFRNPEVTDPKTVKLEWKDPDEEGLVQFLVTEKGFDLARVQGALKRLKGARAKASQQRIDGMFFGSRPTKPAAAAADDSAASSSSAAAAASSSSSSSGGLASMFAASSASSTPAYLDGPPPGIVYEKPNAKRKAEEAAKGSQKKGPGGLVKKAKTKEEAKASAKASAKKKK